MGGIGEFVADSVHSHDFEFRVCLHDHRIAGLVQVIWLIRALRTFFADAVPVVLIGRIEVDGWVLAFTAVIALGTTIACAFFPAFHLARLQPALKEAARGLASGREGDASPAGPGWVRGRAG